MNSVNSMGFGAPHTIHCFESLGVRPGAGPTPGMADPATTPRQPSICKIYAPLFYSMIKI